MLMGRPKTTNKDLPPRMGRKGNAFYYIPSVGERAWEPLGSDKARALVKWAEYEGKDQGATVRDAWTRYQALHLPSLAKNTQRNYLVSSRAVLKRWGDAPVNELKTSHIAEYLDRAKKKSAANAHVVLLSVLFEKMRRWGWTQNDPCNVRKNKVGRRSRYITDDEFLKLREAARPLVRVVMDLCYLTASRQSDILKLKRADIKEDGLYIVQQKTGAKQVYELTAELRAALDAAKALPTPVRSFEHLIVDRKGEPYTQPRFQKMWTADFAKTGIEGVVFHDIRGKAGTDAKRLGLDYQGLLGHSRRDMSDSYIRAIEGTRVSPLKKL